MVGVIVVRDVLFAEPAHCVYMHPKRKVSPSLLLSAGAFVHLILRHVTRAQRGRWSGLEIRGSSQTLVHDHQGDDNGCVCIKWERIYMRSWDCDG